MNKMITLLLLILTICSFIFYGIVGQDKTWLLGPAFILNYTLISIVMFRKAMGAGRLALGGEGQQSAVSSQVSDVRTPISGSLWIIFIIYSLFLIPQAAIPFESKLVTLFIGGVVGAYFIWGTTLSSFKHSRLVLGALIFVVMLTALYGTVVHFKYPERVLWAERYAVYEGRLMSTYICPNHFAHLMQMLLPFCVALLFIPQAGVYLRILAGYSLLVFLPPLYLTESRAGWLGGIVAVGITVCLLALRRSKRLFVLLVVLVPLCSVLLLLAGWKYSEPFQRRMTPVVEFLQGQAEEGVGSEARDFRPQTWMDTIDMIKESPMIGFGPGNYRYTYPEYRKRFRGHRIVTGHPHNEYLELIADYGLIGFGLFGLAWIYGLVRILTFSLKTPNQHHAFIAMAFLGTATGTMVHSFFDFQMHVYPNSMFFALLAAMACGPLVAQRATNTGRKKRLSAVSSEQSAETNITSSSRVSLWLNKAAVWLLAIGFFVGTLFCLQIMGSSFIRAMGDKAAQAQLHAPGSMLHAQNLYELATKIDPQNWRAYKGMAKLYFDQRYYALDMDLKLTLAEDERAWFEEAYQHNPKDPEIVLGLGKCLLFLARSEVRDRGTEKSNTPNVELPTFNLQATGLELLREACQYRKFNDAYWWALGVELRKAGQYEEALEVFLATEKISRSPSILKNIQWIRAKLKGNGDKEVKTGSQTAIETEHETNLRLKADDTDLSDLLDLMGE
jgi:O-antigen ligase